MTAEATRKMTEAYKMAEAGWLEAAARSNAAAGSNAGAGSKAEQIKTLYAALQAEHMKNMPAEEPPATDDDPTYQRLRAFYEQTMTEQAKNMPAAWFGFQLPPQPIPEERNPHAELVRQWERFFAVRPELKALAHRQTQETHAILEREFLKWSSQEHSNDKEIVRDSLE
jgi:hypothetical protein